MDKIEFLPLMYVLITSGLEKKEWSNEEKNKGLLNSPESRLIKELYDPAKIVGEKSVTQCLIL